jgi:DNA-binding NtrC family response regulator
MALILVGDDNFDDLLFLKEFLLGLGHELRLATSTHMILDLIQAESFEFLILSLDVFIKENSFNLLAKVGAQNSQSIMILLASQTGTDSLPRLDASRYHVLSKPLDLDKLKEILGQVS